MKYIKKYEESKGEFKPGQEIVCIDNTGISDEAIIKLKNGGVYTFIEYTSSEHKIQSTIIDEEGNVENFFSDRFMDYEEYKIKKFNL